MFISLLSFRVAKHKVGIIYIVAYTDFDRPTTTYKYVEISFTLYRATI